MNQSDELLFRITEQPIPKRTNREKGNRMERKERRVSAILVAFLISIRPGVHAIALPITTV